MSAEAFSSPTATPATILVVDDDQGARSLLRRILERAGFAVILADDGHNAMAQLRGRKVDLVVTDMVMPEMDGIELMRALVAEQPLVPIVALSGVNDWGYYLRIALRLGARAGLRKPMKAAELVATVRDLLAAPREAAPAALAK